MLGEISDRFLTLDGKRFHYIWLRDNCLSPKYRQSSSFQSIYDISNFSELPRPLSVKLQDEQLIIDWDEDPPHRSIFPVSWLLDYTYDPEPETPGSSEILWDRAWIDQHLSEWVASYALNPEWWIDGVLTLGFAVVKNIAPEDLESFILSIGPIYHSEYGKFATIKVIPGDRDVAMSAGELPPHTDFSYFQQHSIVQFLYCMENEASGGESILVDGFRVAEDFRQQHPDYFQILAQTPIQFRQFDRQWKCLFSRTTPILALDQNDRLTGVYFCPKNRNHHLPFEKMELFYEAYSCFFRYLKKPDYQYCFRLEAGDCLLVNNFRVLHGRKSFDSGSGSRHLEVGYIPGDYFSGRQNFRQFQHLYPEMLGRAN